jgi:hypothetical protein
MRRRPALAALLLVVAVSTGACAGPVGPDTPGNAPPPPGASGKTRALTPGITELGSGRVVASGWVDYVDLETGFWAVMSASPTQSAIQPGVIAVLLPGEITAADLENVKGTFVGAEGVLQSGTSIRMAGPEVLVDALRVY